MAPRLYLEHYLAGIIDNDGTDIQAMWSNGRDAEAAALGHDDGAAVAQAVGRGARRSGDDQTIGLRSEEHTSELQSRQYLVCRLLLDKKSSRARMATRGGWRRGRI